MPELAAGLVGTRMLAEIERMSVPERLQLLDEIWESLAAAPEEVPVTPAQREELRRRVAAYRANPQEGASWEVVKAKMGKP
jgi:putative addiction module component (TIGR02574 family)